MKNKLFAFFGAAFFLICSIPFSVAAEEPYSESATTQTFYSLVSYSRMKRGQTPLYILDSKGNADSNIDTVGEVKTLADGILASKNAKNSIQNWINTTLTKNCASGSEWYIIALSQNGKYDFKTYQNALANYLENNMPGASQTAFKFALALVATGKRDGIVQTIADRPVTNKDSIMAYVYGLHLLNNGIGSKANSIGTLKAALLNMQRPDGGWAIAGKNGDVDVTAMVLQSLASHYNEPDVKNSVDKAVAFLSSRQNANGTFSTMGKENCESTVQVITALSDLKIDCKTDTRFQKNGKTPFDGLNLFRLSSGGFSHLQNDKQVAGKSSNKSSLSADNSANGKASSDKSNTNGTKNGDNSVISDKKTQDKKTTGDTKDKESPNKDNHTKSNSTKANKTRNRGTISKKPIGYKPVVVFVAFMISAGVALLLYFKKKANIKNIALIICIFVCSALFVVLTNFESVSGHNKVLPKNEPVGTVTVSIRCDNLVGKSDSENIPKDGCILPETEIEIEKGETVYDILCDAVKQNSIHMEKKGANGFIYISAINNIYEFEFGDTSGWVYHVNGKSPFVGCDNYKVESGDKIEWMYTLDLGVDTGNTFDNSGGDGS